MADLHLGDLVDPAKHERTGTGVTVDTAELTTHGVIVGMTGSGKTGLGVVLIEEALSNDVPCLLIDPKGDLTNLCLVFPALGASDFRPWIDESQAKQAGATPDDFAAEQAETWKKGLAAWGIEPSRLQALVGGVDFTIYTPGSTAGVPVNIVGSLQAPEAAGDLETMRDEIDGYVSGLLGLVGIEADPLSSREHILLSNLIETSWTAGRSLDLATLVGEVQSPPIRKLGVFELDSFFPPKDRTAFALKLNSLLASPSFSAWAAGPPLDIGALLRTPEGKARAAILSIGHLSDEERQFVVALVLAKVVTWMRKQTGTTDLRAMVYMDEVAGYVPPSANPPTKKPILLLLKQARAFGIGLVLSTQNPVDIDYKGISNAGMWMVGRLQTERDKGRLLDGMSAAAGGVDVKEVGDTISGLGKREFVLHRAAKDKPEVFTTRWAMSYLRGPLTRDQIATLMQGRAEAAPATPAASPAAEPAAAAPAAATATAADESTVMPNVAQGIGIRYLSPSAPWAATVGAVPNGTRLQAAAIARVHLRYDDEKADLLVDEEWEAVLPLTATADPSTATAVDYDDRDLVTEAPTGPRYVLTDAAIGQKTFWTQLQRDLVDLLVRSRTMEIRANKQLKLWSRPGETPEQFADRCRQAADGGADDATAALRAKYETKAKRLRDQLMTAQARVEQYEVDARASRTDDLLSTAGGLLGSFLGGRRGTRSLARQMSRSAGGTSSRRRASTNQRRDAAADKFATLEQDAADLEAQLADEIAAIDQTWDEKAAAVDTVPITLEKGDVDVTSIALLWLPVG
jgi:Helicase HerA, central domain